MWIVRPVLQPSLRLAFLAFPPTGTQSVMHLLKLARCAPATKGSIDVLSSWEFFWQHPLGTAGANHVAAGIDQQPARVARRSPSTTCVIKQIFNQTPFGIRQAAGIGLFWRGVQRCIRSAGMRCQSALYVRFRCLLFS